jgi:hypothetical protein
MARVICYLFGTAVTGTILLGGLPAPLHAQNLAIEDLKDKISAARIVQEAFAKGLQHCGELNGANFYFQPRDRVLNLMDYHRSLDSLAMQRAFNPDTQRPWSEQDAETRWNEVQKEAAQHQANCALVASLPFLQKKLQELQQQAAVSPKAPGPASK